MRLDVRRTLYAPVLVFFRVHETGSEDRYGVFSAEGCWRDNPTRTTDGAGNETTSQGVRVQIPDDGEFAPYGRYLNGAGEWTLSRGDYVARGTARGSVVTFEDGATLDTASAKASDVIKAVRAHGGKAVSSWRDCRRPVSVAGACGGFASMIHIEA